MCYYMKIILLTIKSLNNQFFFYHKNERIRIHRFATFDSSSSVKQ